MTGLGVGWEVGGRFSSRSHRVSLNPHCRKERRSSFSLPPEGLVWYEDGFSEIGGSGTKTVGVGDAWLPRSHQGYRDDCWAGALDPWEACCCCLFTLVAARPERHRAFWYLSEGLPF